MSGLRLCLWVGVAVVTCVDLVILRCGVACDTANRSLATMIEWEGMIKHGSCPAARGMAASTIGTKLACMHCWFGMARNAGRRRALKDMVDMATRTRNGNMRSS
jgi:hypothetical protein